MFTFFITAYFILALGWATFWSIQLTSHAVLKLIPSRTK